MRDPRYDKLLPVVKAGLEEAGVDLAQDVAVDWEPDWPRPPLYTDLSLAGRPAQAFLNCVTPIDKFSFAGVYDTFLRLFLLRRSVQRRPRAQLWLNKRALPNYDGWMLFTPTRTDPYCIADREGIYKNALQLAALAAYSGGKVEVSDDRNFLVSWDEYTFGMRDACLITDTEGNTHRTREFCVPGVPVVDKLRGGNRMHVAPEIVKIRQLIMQQGVESPALELALLALAWRMSSRSSPWLRDMIYACSSGAPMRQACREASHFREFTQPLPVLREMFVPDLLSHSKFHALFGYPAKGNCIVGFGETLPEKYAQRWDAALEELSPGYQFDD